jgi:hypothetical protein
MRRLLPPPNRDGAKRGASKEQPMNRLHDDDDQFETITDASGRRIRVARDGAAIHVPLMMMDSVQRAVASATLDARLRDLGDPRGEPGPPGPPGKIERSYDYVVDAVHYRRDIVTHCGSTYQARCDTAREPPHEDWICVAHAGVDGKDGRDGRSVNVRGTFKAGESYRALDIVALNGGSFIAKKDNPGPCPGAGWQLIASQGKRGDKGGRGLQGIPGVPVVIQKWRLDRDNYIAVPVMSDGREGPPLELRPLFEQFHNEAR